MNLTNPESSEISTTSVRPRAPKTVLLVDDDAKLLRGLQRSLASEEYRILTAISVAEARILLSSEPIELILSDNLMPGVLGMDFLAEARREHPGIKLMMLSGYMPDAVAQRAIDDLGVLQVLFKPCKACDVAVAIRGALSEV